MAKRIEELNCSLDWNKIPVEKIRKIAKLNKDRSGASQAEAVFKDYFINKRGMTNEQWQEQYDAIAPTWEWYRTHAIHPNDPMMVGYLKEVWDKFSCGLAAYIQFYLQPPLMDLPYHYDGRSTNINFVYPHEEVSPLTIEGKDFYYDNFVFDGGYQKHMVRGSASPRFMMQICFWEVPYDKVVQELRRQNHV